MMIVSLFYREARSAETLSAHTVAVGAILTPTHLLAPLAVESRGARLVAVEARPSGPTHALS